MKTIITFLVIFFFSTGLFAQKFVQEWYIDLPGLANSSAATTIMATSDDQLFMAGYSITSSSLGSMFFMKTDTTGNVIQTTFAEEQFTDTYQFANRLIEDIDNNYVMIGRYSYYNSTYFTKLSPDGDVIGTHINGSQWSYKGGNDVLQTVDSGYLVSAQHETYGMGMCTALRKLDASGNFVWDTTFVFPEDSTPIVGNFARMAKIDDSTFVLTGNRDYALGYAQDLDVLLTKIRVRDDSVLMLMLKVFQQDGTNEQGYDIKVLPDNEGYLICGYGPNENNPGVTVGLIMRTDTAGNLTWKETYTLNLSSSTIFVRVLLDEDENILVLARTQDQYNSNGVSLLKYTLNGEFLQKTHFDYGEAVLAYDMATDQNGKIFVSASTANPAGQRALLLKVKDICPVIKPEATLENTTPNMGNDVVVNVQNTNNAWIYSLLQINGETTLGTFMGNGETLDFTVAGLNNDDVADGLVVSVIEPGVNCIKYSDTLYPEFICPVQAPEVFLADTTLFYGDDVVVTVKNTVNGDHYSLIQIYEHNTLATATGTGSDYNFTVSGLTNDSVSEGLVVSVTRDGIYCKEYSDTLYPVFVDGIEDYFNTGFAVSPNPFNSQLTILSNGGSQITHVSLFNTNGVKVFNTKSTNKKQITIPSLPSGVYLLRVTFKTGTVAYRKVVRE